MTPTSKAEMRERAREFYELRINTHGNFPNWTTETVADFAESEALLARKEEREACAKVAEFAPITFATESLIVICKRIAAAIHQRNEEVD